MRRRFTSALLGISMALSMAAVGSLAPKTASAEEPSFLAGRGMADMTGEPGENGMMGYGDSRQKSAGIHSRQFARAYVIVDPKTNKRVVFLSGDMLSGTNLERELLLKKLREKYGDKYNDGNVLIAATHTHSTPGGTTDYSLYNITTMGVHKQSLDATVDGFAKAIDRAEADLAPSQVSFGSDKVEDAGVNRSMDAFMNNPKELRDKLPGDRDSRSDTMAISRDGKVTGFVNWMATHATTLPTENKLISSDNKGYAEYLDEVKEAGVDYTKLDSPSMVAAYVYSNGGDQTPNLGLKPATGPSSDPFKSVEILGKRIHDGAERSLQKLAVDDNTTVDYRMMWVDMQNQKVAPEFSTTGKEEKTCRAIVGAPFGSGSEEDGGGGVTFLGEGLDKNELMDSLTKTTYDATPGLKDCQGPKKVLFESGMVDSVQGVLPVQVLRIGDHYILGMPGEVTSASGVLMREAFAKSAGTTVDKVMVSSAANAYGHYFTTPWEYDRQNYEGGATIYGRYTVPALNQALAAVGKSFKEGGAEVVGTAPKIRPFVYSAYGKVLHDTPGTHKYGDVLIPVRGNYRKGDVVKAVFQGSHPNVNIRHEGTYLQVQKREGDKWVDVAKDSDFSTKFNWKRKGISASEVTMEWDTTEAEPGTYRMVYNGTSRAPGNHDTEFQGVTGSFQVE